MVNVLDLNRFTGLFALCIVLTACGGSGSSGDSAPGAVEPLQAAQSLSYYSHTKALIDSRCVTCHRAGGQGPFPLSEYSQVAAKRSAMIYAMESRNMPPPGFARLTDQERELLLQWLNEGAAEGNPQQSNDATPYTYY